MCFLGVGEMIGSQVNGYFQDHTSQKLVMLINMAELTVAVAVLILYTFVWSWSLWFASIVTFCWGVQDSGANCFLNALLGF